MHRPPRSPRNTVHLSSPGLSHAYPQRPASLSEVRGNRQGSHAKGVENCTSAPLMGPAIGYVCRLSAINHSDNPVWRSLEECISLLYHFPRASAYIYLTIHDLDFPYLIVCQIASINNQLHYGGLKNLCVTMSTAVESSLPIRAAKQSTTHPLAPVDAAEIKQAVAYVRAQWPTDTDLHFKCITLQEPAKKEAIPYLEAEASGTGLPQIDRRILITYYLRRTVSCRLIAIQWILLRLSLTLCVEQISRSRCESYYWHARIQCPSWPQLARSRRRRRDRCY